MHDRTLDRLPALVLAGLSATLWLAVPEAGAVSCPGSGAKVKVVVNNPTGSTVSNLTVTVSGSSITDQITCTSESGSYSHNLTSLAPGDNEVYLPTSGGLVTGMWKHHIEVSTTGQEQHQKGVTLYASSQSDYSVVRWTYFPQVITVNEAGDSGSTSCPSTCTFRRAIERATNTLTGSATSPILIQFAVSPGAMTNSSSLEIGSTTKGYITIDGTGEDGDPWIVGDALAAAQGNQDPFPTVIDLASTTHIEIKGSHIMLKGLEIANTTETETAGELVGIGETAAHVRLDSVRLDGGGAEMEDASYDYGQLIRGDGGPVTVVNTEGRSAMGVGIEFSNAEAALDVSDSWLHHNHFGNLWVNSAVLSRSTIETGGVRAYDDAEVEASATGLTNLGTGNIETSQNLIRNNASSGLEVSLLSLAMKDDYVCGNGGVGAWIDVPSSATEVTGAGLTTAYNGGHGVHFDSFIFPPADGTLTFDDRNAFTANQSCGLKNEAGITVSAENNQWRGVVSGSCSSAADRCSGGSVSCSTVIDYLDDEIDFDATTPIVPTNVILKGQTIRILGTGFDAISGNPLASGSPSCEIGFDTSSDGCCHKKDKANTCGSGSPPNPALANCVAGRGYGGAWSKLPVTAVTPTTITAEIADTVHFCQGEQDEIVRVARLDSVNGLLEGEADYCTNQFPM